MFAKQIERMKLQYTDKYVVVDLGRPELARFRDVVGRVKTVNMSGRALVEFDDYHLNTGWYDIDPEFLKVVDKPPPKAPKPEVKKPAAVAKPAGAKPAAKPAPAAGAQAGKSSVADILAKARAGKATPAPAKPPAPEASAPNEAPVASAQPAKVDRSKMSVADMLAAARAGTAGSATTPAPKVRPAVAPVQEQAVSEEPVAEAAPTGEVAAGRIQRVDKSKMSIDDILVYCRQHDAK
jgi:hypothetical protein